MCNHAKNQPIRALFPIDVYLVFNDLKLEVAVCFVDSGGHSCEVYSIQHYVIKFLSNLRQVSGFLTVLRFPPDCHNITEILLKVALNTIARTTPLRSLIAVELLTSNIWTFYNWPCLQLLPKGSYLIFCSYIVRHSCMISNNVHATYILTFVLWKCICLTNNHINNVQQNNMLILFTYWYN